jgi:hypothetical protein
MKAVSINQYPNYQNGAAGLNFEHYYTGQRDWLKVPEVLLYHIKEKLSPDIDTILIFGCASGRDFIPFQDSYNCIGFDIAPPNVIDWVCDTTRLTYYQCSIQDFIPRVDTFDINWKNTLIYSCVSLMYASHENQNNLVELMWERECKNIVLQEYEPGNSAHHPYLGLTENNLKRFSRHLFRPKYKHEPTAHIFMENTNEEHN